MPEHFEGERCPQCGYPSGHSSDCPKSQRLKATRNVTLKDELPKDFDYDTWAEKPGRRMKEILLMKAKVNAGRLNIDEAQQEAIFAKDRAAKIKAHREVGELTGKMNELGLEKPLWAEEDLAETLQRQRILEGESEQPTKEDYDSGVAGAERDAEALESLRKRLKRF